MKKYLGELVATFALVFAGTGPIIINDTSGGVVTHVGIALTFGLIVLATIYAVGDGFWLLCAECARSVIAGAAPFLSLPRGPYQAKSSD